MSQKLMISVSGIRGIVGNGLTPQFLADYAAAAGTFYGTGPVYVGRDSRVTGEMVKSAVFAGLMSVGCDPVDLGICPTPSVELAVQNSDAVGGIIITASHNPIEWNALKLLTSHGLFLDEEQGTRVKSIIDEKAFKYVKWDGIGKISSMNSAIDEHIDAILALDFIDVEKIRARQFRIAYDCVNGAGGTILPQLLQKLGCTTFPLNEEPTGRFAHTPEPVPQNIQDLCRHVKVNKADIGFAVDPDVDRLAIVADNGEPIGEEYTIVLATQFICGRTPGSVVVNVSTTRAVEDVAHDLGCEVIRTKVGEIHVATKMKEIGAVVGGEGNGGLLLPDLHLGRDAPLAIAVTLQHLANQDKPISQVWKSLPQYTMTKKKISVEGRNSDAIIDNLAQLYKNETLNWIDGLKIDRADSWVQVRKSNTEPIIRVMSEAKTAEDSVALCDEVMGQIEKMS